MTFSDLEGRDAKVTLSGTPSIMHQPFDLERPQIFTKFDRVTQVGEGRVSMESDTHPS